MTKGVKVKVVARPRARADYELVAVLASIAVVVGYNAAFLFTFTGCTSLPPQQGHHSARAALAVTFCGASAIAIFRGVLVLRAGQRARFGAYVALGVILLVSAIPRLLIAIHGDTACMPLP